jgi:hypothetical protein
MIMDRDRTVIVYGDTLPLPSETSITGRRAVIYSLPHELS